MSESGDWKLRPDGSIEAHPIVGWEAGSILGTGVLRVAYAETPAELESPRRLQLAITEAQIRMLAGDLIEMLHRIDAAEPQGEA